MIRCWRLADERIAQEAFSTAIEPLDRLISSNPTNEAAVQRLIFVLARLKRRGEAIRAYQKFTAALKSRHNTEPSTGTYALFEAVQRGDDPLVMPANTSNPVGADLSRPAPIDRPRVPHDAEHPDLLSQEERLAFINRGCNFQ